MIMNRLLLTLLISFVPLAHADEQATKRVMDELSAKAIQESLSQAAKEVEEEQYQEASWNQEKEYVTNIRMAIMNSWSRPGSARNGMEAEVELLLLPSGQVANVRVVRGSGDKAFDDSTLAAVKQVGSFRLPEDSDLYEKNPFKRIILIFRPEDLKQ